MLSETDQRAEGRKPLSRASTIHGLLHLLAEPRNLPMLALKILALSALRQKIIVLCDFFFDVLARLAPWSFQRGLFPCDPLVDSQAKPIKIKAVRFVSDPSSPRAKTDGFLLINFSKTPDVWAM